MKKTLKKLLICILIILIINNFFMSNISLAANSFEEALSDLLGSVVGILSWIPRMFALGVGYAVNTLTAAVAYSQGSIDDDGNILPDTFFNNAMITPFDIFFNKVALLDVNFFNIPNDGTVISNIRTSIAAWYYVMRNVASAILLCVLVYVGIRMAISTVASDKAAYKKMLVDWVCSLALIFLLHYIIIFTFAVNEAFIKGLSNVADGKELSDVVVLISKEALGVDVNAIGATIVFCMLVFQTLGLVITYINRMLKIAFLIIIAPLITLTYSIDKMGDGKAQALGTWLKEFVYTVLIQVFHCVIYMAFISMAFSIFTNASDENNLAGAILAMLCIKFTKDAEKILGKIFKFSDSTSDTSIGVGLAASAMALGYAKNMGKTARSAVTGIKNMKANVGSAARNARIEAMALGAMLAGAKNEDGSKKSFAEAKDDAAANLQDKEADKIAAKNAKKYKVVENKDSDEFKAKVAANMQSGMSEKLARATARNQMAKEARAKGKSDNLKNNHKVISGAKSALANVKKVASQSETLKLLGDMNKSYIAAGLGMAVGSFAYSESDALQAIMTGTAIYSGSKEFMSTSTKTLTNDVSKLLEGAGISDMADAGLYLNNIMQNKDMYEDDKDKLDEIYKEIESALGSLTSDQKSAIKTHLKNVVDKEIKDNPNISNSDLFKKVSENNYFKDIFNDPDKKDKINSNAFIASIDNMSNFRRESAVYADIKNASNIGLAPDRFIQDSLKAYETTLWANAPGAARDDKVQENKEIVKEIVENGENIDAESIVQERNEAEIKDLEKRMQSAINTTKELENYARGRGETDLTKYEDKIKRIEENLNEVAKESIDKHMEKLDKELQDCRNRLKTEADTQVRLQLQNVFQAIVKEYGSLVKEAKKYGTTDTISMTTTVHKKVEKEYETIEKEEKKKK